MRKLFMALGLLLSAVIIGCNKDSKVDPVETFTSTLSGANEESPNPSTATGTASGSYNRDTKILTVTVTYTGLTPTTGHIHKGTVGVSGPVIFPFMSLASPINFTSPELDAMQEADLMAGLYYINLHTAAYPAGEIRGQLVKN